MIRYGLCCKFNREPIKFRDTTATRLAKLPRPEQLSILSGICRDNVKALRRSIEYCAAHNIGSFRINSRILPLKTHPQSGYNIADLPDGPSIIGGFRECGALATQTVIRLTFHPDQFVLLNSPRPEVVESSLKELAYQNEVADWVGADVINIHGGGMYGNKTTALAQLTEALCKLPESLKKRLTLENDDRTYTPADLLPVCLSSGIPLVYDVHHHRCNPDSLSIAEATTAALATWDREPLFHLSSPRDGWSCSDPRPHHDYIDPQDFPPEWLPLNITVEIEAKAKEDAIARLQQDMTP